MSQETRTTILVAIMCRQDEIENHLAENIHADRDYWNQRLNELRNAEREVMATV